MNEKANLDNLAAQKEPLSPLRMVVNSHGEELEKLHGLLNELERKLEHLRLPMPSEDSEDMSKTMAEPGGSATVSQIARQTDHVKTLQSFVHRLMNELEA